jgi:hypothetical protein
MWTCVIYVAQLREQGRAGRRNIEVEGREASIAVYDLRLSGVGSRPHTYIDRFQTG